MLSHMFLRKLKKKYVKFMLICDTMKVSFLARDRERDRAFFLV